MIDLIRARIFYVLVFALVASGISQIVIGVFLGPVLVMAETIPMTNNFNADRSKDRLVIKQLNVFSRHWNIVAYNGLAFTSLGLIFLLANCGRRSAVNRLK